MGIDIFQSRVSACCMLSHFSRVQLFATPWIVEAPLSMEPSRQENWSGLLYLSPGDLPNPGVERILILQS